MTVLKCWRLYKKEQDSRQKAMGGLSVKIQAVHHRSPCMISCKPLKYPFD